MKAEIKKFFKTNENEDTTHQKSAYMRSKGRSKINTLPSKFKELEEEDQKNSKPSIRQEITKIRAELKEIETRKTLQKNQ